MFILKLTHESHQSFDSLDKPLLSELIILLGQCRNSASVRNEPTMAQSPVADNLPAGLNNTNTILVQAAQPVQQVVDGNPVHSIDNDGERRWRVCGKCYPHLSHACHHHHWSCPHLAAQLPRCWTFSTVSGRSLISMLHPATRRRSQASSMRSSMVRSRTLLIVLTLFHRQHYPS